jgi:hypothetical protein
MASNNRKCKTCGLEYHHCNSCGWGGEWYDVDVYCCESCAANGPEHTKLKKKITNFIETLSPEQRSNFVDIANIIDENDTEFYYIINNELKGRLGIEAWGLW